MVLNNRVYPTLTMTTPKLQVKRTRLLSRASHKKKASGSKAMSKALDPSSLTPPAWPEFFLFCHLYIKISILTAMRLL